MRFAAPAGGPADGAAVLARRRRDLPPVAADRPRLPRRGAGDRGRHHAVGLRHGGRSRAAAARAVQPQAPFGRARRRLPLLPHHGGDPGDRRPAADPYLHDLPLADLDGLGHAQARAGQLHPERAPAMGAPEPAAAICLLQSLRARDEGHRLLHLSRRLHGDADDVSRQRLRDAVLPRLPPQSGEVRPHPGSGLEHELDAAAGSGDPRAEARGAEPHPRRRAPRRVLRVPPLMRADADLGALRARLAGGGGPAFWRSLDAGADTPEFRAYIEAEVPAAGRRAGAPERRGFLKLMAASFALAGLSACDGFDGRRNELPYVNQPERIVPGASLTYASCAVFDGFANGVLVTTRNGRPLKIEGNPEHPWTRGGTDVLAQASVLGLYDPFRSQAVQHLGRPSSWAAFRGAMAGFLAAWRESGGRGLALLTGPITS